MSLPSLKSFKIKSKFVSWLTEPFISRFQLSCLPSSLATVLILSLHQQQRTTSNSLNVRFLSIYSFFPLSFQHFQMLLLLQGHSPLFHSSDLLLLLFSGLGFSIISFGKVSLSQQSGPQTRLSTTTTKKTQFAFLSFHKTFRSLAEGS